MKAWVISVLSFDAIKSDDMVDEVVLSLVSARRTGSQVKSYIEMVASIFRSNLEEQRVMSAYVNGRSDIVARVHSYACVTYVDHPYVFRGQKSDIVSIDENGQVSWIKWKGMSYPRFQKDPVTHNYKKVEEIRPPFKYAPQASIGRSLYKMFSKDWYLNT